MNRREFLATAGVPRRCAVADPARHAGQGRHEGAGAGHGRVHLRSHPRLGRRCRPRIKWGNTHGVVEDAQGNIYVHHTVHATSDSADTVVVFDRRRASSSARGGAEFRGVAHGLHIRKEGQGRVPLPDRQRRQPEDDAAAGAAGRRRQDDAEGGDRLEDPGSAGHRGVQARPRTARPKPYNPTNVAIAPNGDIYVGDGYGSYYINQYNSKAEYIRTFGGKGSEPGQLDEPHGIWVDTRGGAPVLVVADRRNNRLQRFTLDGAAHRLRPRLPAAVPLRRAARAWW